MGCTLDIFEMLKSTIFVAFPRFSLFINFYQNNDVARYIIGGTGYLFTFASLLDSFCLTLSKHIAIIFPYFFKKNWSHRIIQVNVIVTIILPIIVFSYQFGTKDRLIYDENTKGYVYSSQTPEISKINNTIAPIFSSIILIIQLTLNIINFYKIKYTKNPFSSFIKYKYISKIVIYCLISTIGIAITTIRFWIKYYGAFYDSSFRNLGQSFGIFLSIVSITCEPYLLLITNKKIRYEYFIFYGKKNNQVESVT